MVEIDKLEDIIMTLGNGGLILYPTDTIWGIGCDACNTAAVHKIYELKKRELSKPFILLVNDMEMLRNYVEEVHPRIDTLMAYHTRPLTVVYEKAKNLPPNIVAADGSVAIRIVQDDFCKRMIAAYGKPLVATSANISNEPFPTNFGGISSDVIQGIDYVVRRNQFDKESKEPSVLVRLSQKGELIFLRE